MNNLIDTDIYLIADLTEENSSVFFKKTEALLAQGIKLFQLRAKEIDENLLPFYIEKLKKISEKYGAGFIINDFWYFVREFELDGVHLGKEDFPPEIARYILDDKIIGYTVNNIKDLSKEVLAKIDYIGVGPAFSTRTKKRLSPVLTPQGIYEIIKNINIPYFSIGGIKDNNIEELLTLGINRFAISSYLMNSDNPAIAYDKIKSQIDKFLR